MSRVWTSATFVFFLIAIFSFAQEQQQNSADQKTYMGTQICANCHLNIYENFKKSAHGISKDPRSPEGKEGCENCHGPGAMHSISGGGKGVGDLIVFNAKANIESQNQVCLNCHNQGKVALWHSSIHESKNLACVSCHQIHSTNAKLLIAATESQTCAGCHQEILAELQRTSHHPIREGKINCSDCHNPHGATTEKLISANSINEKCYECHAEKRGPFLWEHPPARENCLNCHQPHGSVHETLLTAKLPYLCQRCHSNSLHVGILYAVPPGVPPESVYNQRLLGVLPLSQMSYRSCSNCHVNVHGSNHPSGTFWHR
jgi:DmsE family decaheme c-type cytochrome